MIEKFSKFWIGAVLGAVTAAIAAVLFFSIQTEKATEDSASKNTLPQFGEEGYDPEVSGYPALIGAVKEWISENEMVMVSSMCLYSPCEPGKNYEYTILLGTDTVAKRLVKKTAAEFKQETENRENKNDPPNPYNEFIISPKEIAAGESISVLIAEIINKGRLMVKEIRIFEPL